MKKSIKEALTVAMILAALIGLLLIAMNSLSTEVQWQYQMGEAPEQAPMIDLDDPAPAEPEHILSSLTSPNGQWLLVHGKELIDSDSSVGELKIRRDFLAIQRPGPIMGRMDLLPGLADFLRKEISEVQVESADFSADGRWLVAAVWITAPSDYLETAVLTWEVSSGKIVGYVDAAVDRLKFSPVRNVFAVCEVRDRQQVYLVDAERDSERWVHRLNLEGLDLAVHRMEFSPDGQYLVVAGATSSDSEFWSWLRIVEVESGRARLLDHIYGEDQPEIGSFKGLRFTPDSRAVDVMRAYISGGTETKRIQLR